MSHFKKKKHDFHMMLSGKRNLLHIAEKLSVKNTEVRDHLKSKKKNRGYLELDI